VFTGGRLDSYEVTPNTGVCSRTLAAYALNAAACEAFYPLLQTVEIALRNRLDAAIGGLYGHSWFDRIPFMPEWQANCIAEARERLSRGNTPRTPAHDEVVAELDLGFWTGLLNRRFSVHPSGDLRFWPRLVPSVFPNLPSQPEAMPYLRTTFDELRKFRNRVFHHEPILPKRGGRVNLDTVGRDLQTRRAWILNAIRWMSPEAAKLVSAFDRVPEVAERGVHRWLSLEITRIAR
jgi:hypothetical protein